MDTTPNIHSEYLWALPKCDLHALYGALTDCGYEVHGPQVDGSAIVYGPLENVDQLPHGVVDQQDGGYYRIHKDPTAGTFDHVVGPHSLKEYLFPPRQILQKWRKTDQGWLETTEKQSTPKIAVLGVRSCDLRAIEVQDKVFLDNDFIDSTYQSRRENLCLISVQCRRAASTCFCASMNAGPKATRGFDLALTELEDVFLVEVGSDLGQTVLASLPNLRPASPVHQNQAASQSRKLEEQMLAPTTLEPGHESRRWLDTDGLRELLINNLEHSLWDEIGKRCLSCANCTMVCPTCFCSSVNEVTELTDEEVLRERSWTSCFNAEHSYTATGVVHASTASRYRQWLTHKFSTWHDQFDTSGCVGCGRCITWCPVGIDLTEELATLRSESS